MSMFSRDLQAKIRPIEEKFHFVETNSPCLEDSDFVAKPFILVLGQYSTGKTTFIEHLIQREYPGQRIGPEPTTDHFIAVMYGNEDRATPGTYISCRASPFLIQYTTPLVPRPLRAAGHIYVGTSQGMRWLHGRTCRSGGYSCLALHSSTSWKACNAPRPFSSHGMTCHRLLVDCCWKEKLFSLANFGSRYYKYTL